jgi:hypothetical protein
MLPRSLSLRRGSEMRELWRSQTGLLIGLVASERRRSGSREG